MKTKEELENKVLKANFRIGGNHEGKETLLCDKTGSLEINKRFNGKNIISANLKRPNIGANLLKIYEGVTISYAQENEDNLLSIFERLGLKKKSVKNRYMNYLRKKDKNPIYPFIPFAKDSEGGISIMIYYGKGCGDIVIDCGFTKCFLEMKEEGTFRYIRNLSAVTSRCDVLMKDGEDPQTWKPDFINYKLDLSKNYFWEYYQRKIYFIEVDKPLCQNNKLFIYEQIINGLYSEYNNKIYFYSNGIHQIKLEDIIKENSLNHENNTQNNMGQIANNIIKECNEKFGNNYIIEIFTDGYCINNDNMFIDYILSNDEININRRNYQLLPELDDVNISSEFTQETFIKIENIKTYEEFNNNYKDIRNCLIFLPYQYAIDINKEHIKNELDRISKDIIDNIQNDQIKKELNNKMKVLIFYLTTEVEDVALNTAAFKDI